MVRKFVRPEYRFRALTVSGLILCSNMILLGLVPSAGAFDSPRMEISVVVTCTAGARDGIIDVHIITRYCDNSNPQNEFVLPGAYYEVINNATQNVECCGYTSKYGIALEDINVNAGGSKNLKIKVCMGSTVQAQGHVECGMVVNSESETYYGITSVYECNDDNIWTFKIIFKDSGGAGNSFVGAAAIYATAYYSMAIFNNNIIDQDAENGDTNIKIVWPCNGPSAFIPASGQDPSELRISQDYFQDDAMSTWATGYDSVRHNHAHLIHFALGYEESYWPSGEPTGLGWHEEMTTEPSGTEMEWAFVDGFADFWAALSDVRDGDFELEDDVVCFDIPDGHHIETDVWIESLMYDADALTGVSGERTEGFIANLFWDMIDNASYPDQDPNADDDHLRVTLNNFWKVININMVHTIYDFWDHCMYQDDLGPLGRLICLEEVFLMNNVGRYVYEDEDGPFTDPYETDDNLEFSRFEVLGMNPSPPQLKQRVLARYVLKNTDPGNGITFDPLKGIDISYTDPNANNGAFGVNYKNFFLPPNKKIINFGYCELRLQGRPQIFIWSFWPHYTLANPPKQSSQFDVWTVEILDIIFFDDFETPWPSIYTVIDNSQTSPSFQWNQVIWDGIDGDDNLCVWCAGIDSDNNTRSPRTGLLYENNQDTSFYLSADFRYIGLTVGFQGWLQFDNKNNNDKLVLWIIDGASFINIRVFDFWDNTQNVGIRGEDDTKWNFFQVAIPHIAFKAGSNMIIGFQFISDDQNVEIGAFIDHLQIDTTNRA